MNRQECVIDWIIEIGSSLINQRELSIQRKQESTLNMRSILARILPHSCTFLREILPNTAAAVTSDNARVQACLFHASKSLEESNFVSISLVSQLFQLSSYPCFPTRPAVLFNVFTLIFCSITRPGSQSFFSPLSHGSLRICSDPSLLHSHSYSSSLQFFWSWCCLAAALVRPLVVCQ